MQSHAPVSFDDKGYKKDVSLTFGEQAVGAIRAADGAQALCLVVVGLVVGHSHLVGRIDAPSISLRSRQGSSSKGKENRGGGEGLHDEQEVRSERGFRRKY